VAVDAKDQPVAYLLVDTVDNAAHIEQVSVDPDYAGRRIDSVQIDRAGTGRESVCSMR
jgi:ribosomal protein S18 acetylase RimI-like enzyme